MLSFYRRPLYKPCRCRGSIGLTHQDCLQSWLDVRQRSGVAGACELCKTKFQFVPLYKDNAPERLPLLKFVAGIVEIATVSWFPSILRIVFAVILWLVVAPLLTAYLYQSWMVRPKAAFSRFQSTELIWADVITGLVIGGVVIVTLLSIMSLADFLRLEWNRPQFNRDHNEREEILPDDIDDGIWIHAQEAVLNRQHATHIRNADDEESWDDLDEDYEDLVHEAAARDEQRLAELHPHIPQQRLFPDNPPDDAPDMDIHLAVDEMLGLRGPAMVVFRNIAWVLAFNAIFLGFFAFVPRSVGHTFCSYAFNMTDPRRLGNETEYMPAGNFTNTLDVAFSSIWSTIQIESIKHQTIFRVEDVVSIAVGYLMIAACTGLMQVFMSMWSKLRSLWDHEATRGGGGGRNNEPEVAEVFHRAGADDADDGVAVVALDYAVKTTFAIVKVGVLLFVKMFLLPVALGFALCLSTMRLVGVSAEEQVHYAGRDIFAFILMHWVAGITFMLLVTVSVLQLREVLHPDVFSRFIRPQEPHPDLLGNLMKESLVTHVRRMSMSFLVYALLLCLFVRIPTRALVSMVLPDNFQEALKLKFAYCLGSRLEAPIELLAFHLLMLTILERHKNTIGTIQHLWLRNVTGALGLSESLLPYSVEKFQKIGSLRVFTDTGELDPFWCDVAKSHESSKLIEQNLESFTNDDEGTLLSARTKSNGEKVLPANADFIRLPKPLPGRALRNKSVLLKTKIGRYRLRRAGGKGFCIQLWEEVRDSPIARPPEGWDDLGVGGAHVQGRWAWGNEKKSAVEHGVADRDRLYHVHMKTFERLTVHAKLAAIFLLSWLSVVLIVVTAFIAPLVSGRFVFSLLRIPQSWIHDPFGWFIGCVFLFRADKKVRFFLSAAMVFARSVPPVRKLRTVYIALFLYVFLAPLQVGAIYDVFFVENKEWFLGLDSYPFPRHPWRLWFLGSILIEHMWMTTDLFGFLPPFHEQAAADPGDEGQAGKARRFWSILTNAVCNSDWEDVDATILLDDFAYPVFVELSVFQLIAIGMPLCLMLSGVGNIVDAASFTRGALLVSVVIRASRAWKGQILDFAEALHRSARDRKYLIGEVLLNYGGTDAQ